MSKYSINTKEVITFDDLIRKLDFYGIGFLAIVDNEDKLIGIVTDGDIRKALLNQKKAVEDIINYNPFTLPYTTPASQLKSFLEEKRRLHVPLVDEENRLKEVFLLNDFTKQFYSNYVVIMVGGLGSRLGELTKEIPKPMLHVKGKPMLEYIVESFKNQGFNKFIFCVNFKKEIIQDYFQDGKKF
ncbi:MAG TPA: CBS domain-containing protein, partial [Flavobacterium sp.]|nr:CBS domain-containing protein [Flavobacterium sp.]